MREDKALQRCNPNGSHKGTSKPFRFSDFLTSFGGVFYFLTDIVFIMERLTIENVKKLLNVCADRYYFKKVCGTVQIYSNDNLFTSTMLGLLQGCEFDFYVTVSKESGLPKVVVY